MFILETSSYGSGEVVEAQRHVDSRFRCHFVRHRSLYTELFTTSWGWWSMNSQLFMFYFSTLVLIYFFPSLFNSLFSFHLTFSGICLNSGASLISRRDLVQISRNRLSSTERRFSGSAKNSSEIYEVSTLTYKHYFLSYLEHPTSRHRNRCCALRLHKELVPSAGTSWYPRHQLQLHVVCSLA